jgi:hypothetical protein
MLDREFYMTTGFSFQGRKGSVYTLRFLAAGKVTKLVAMVVSSPLLISDQVATKENVNQAQYKM